MREELLPTEEPKVWTDKEGEQFWGFESNGFRVYVQVLDEEVSYNFSGNKFSIPKGTLAASWEFTPLMSSTFHTDRRTSAIAKLVKGLSNFFDYLDLPPKEKTLDIPKPAYLFAKTNDRMASFLSNRLGFQREEYFNDWRDVGVAGEIEKIRECLAEIKSRKIGKKSLEEAMLERIGRQVKKLPHHYPYQSKDFDE